MAAGTKRGRKAQATRSVLMEAALEVMSRKGYAAATIDEIAKEAGVSKGLAYYHFENKETLASEILEEGINGLVDSFESVSEEGNGSLEAMLLSLCNGIARDYRFARFYLSAHWCEDGVESEGLQQAEDRLIGAIVDLLEYGKVQGTVREGIDVEFAAISIIGTVLTVAARNLDKTSTEDDKAEYACGVIDFAVNAVGGSVEVVIPEPEPVAEELEPTREAQESAAEEPDSESPVILSEAKDPAEEQEAIDEVAVEPEEEPEPELEPVAAEPDPPVILSEAKDPTKEQEVVDEVAAEPEPAKPKKAKKSKPTPE